MLSYEQLKRIKNGIVAAAKDDNRTVEAVLAEFLDHILFSEVGTLCHIHSEKLWEELDKRLIERAKS